MRLLSSHKAAGIAPVVASKDDMSNYFSIRHQKYGYWQVCPPRLMDTRPPRRWVNSMEYATKYATADEACMVMLFRGIHNGEIVPNTTPFVMVDNVPHQVPIPLV